MIPFKPITITDKDIYLPYLFSNTEHGCEFAFTNLFLWGKQTATILYDHMVLFSQFDDLFTYPYPIGNGNKKKVLDALMEDAKERQVRFRLTSLNAEDIETLNNLYPGQFQIYPDRDFHDYVYAIDDLADLKGGKYQKKRNHLQQFKKAYPDYSIVSINKENLSRVITFSDNWYANKLTADSDSDFQMEREALLKAFTHYEELSIEGLILLNHDETLAFTLGSPLSPNTFDVHFEKARADVPGAYATICNEFARYIREKYPKIEYLDREEDMGIEGLRLAKERYYPHHMVEKSWAELRKE